ncbi:glycosyltransferase family 4 protein [Caulobacter endophyticus]|uniref:glycosyltransferase family 4 protein n=1 Tax=Caulobacter endophyticus TaxID=2172652 RepID=UPI00240F080C|nr:glycosyltransferase family 1 protein [Caulobacter endophyticus]MDG2527246.1 glycosyltransferase family 1 protein [Caulobacter endophyticus]
MDISGLLSRWRQATPTGIDRVEMAYAQALIERDPERLAFGGLRPGGGYARFPTAVVRDYLEATQEMWALGEGGDGARRGRLAFLAMLDIRPTPGGAGRRPRAYLHLSPRGLERLRAYEAALKREHARMVTFVHDLIPLEHPEFVREGGAALFRRKLETLAKLSDGVLVNSQATATATSAHLARLGRQTMLRIAPLGVPSLAPAGRRGRREKPYFVVLGTIEPRKNHLLLLNIWRRWVEQEGAEAAPDLVVVGRRGWENENILDLLDRSPVLGRVVDERGGLGDVATRSLVAGARAVLCPSFAEGYGLAVAEALQLGTPVIASDIAAHREVGGAAPDYLDPLDGPAWARALRDYAQPDSPRRRAQQARLADWKGAGWTEHFQIAFQLIEDVVR